MSTLSAAISCSALTKTFRIHRQRAGLTGAVRSFLRRRVDHRTAVAELDLIVPEGQVIGLLGRNGAGKTTTVKMCCGLIRPSSGTVDVLGHEPARRSFEFLRDISVIFGQKSMLWWDVPTSDSLLVHRAMYDIGPARFRRRVEELSAVLDVGPVLDVPVRRLSLGQRMRCELMLALLHGPRLLFADEPTIGLDVLGKRDLRAFLASLNAEFGTTIVLTSHDMDDVESLCDRIVLIDDGRLRFDGDQRMLLAEVAPMRRVTARFAEPIAPGAEITLGRWADRLDVGADRSTCSLEIPPEQAPEAIARIVAFGPLVDIAVEGADLDDVIATVLSEGER